MQEPAAGLPTRLAQSAAAGTMAAFVVAFA